MSIDPKFKEVVKTADGKPWTQLCLYCSKQIDFTHEVSTALVRIGEYVRHRKCLPPPAK